MAVFSGGGAGVEVLIGSLKLNSLLVSMLRSNIILIFKKIYDRHDIYNESRYNNAVTALSCSVIDAEVDSSLT